MSNEVNEDYQRVLSIVEGYETQLWLKHPENPKLISGENLSYKLKRAEQILAVRNVQGLLTENEFRVMIREFNYLDLRLSNTLLDFVAKKQVILVPSKRNFLYLGEDELLGTLEKLVLYSNVLNVSIVGGCIETLMNCISRADSSCEEMLEFRLILILLMFLLNFNQDIQTISFISQFILSQHKLAVNNY